MHSIVPVLVVDIISPSCSVSRVTFEKETRLSMDFSISPLPIKVCSPTAISRESKALFVITIEDSDSESTSVLIKKWSINFRSFSVISEFLDSINGGWSSSRKFFINVTAPQSTFEFSAEIVWENSGWTTDTVWKLTVPLPHFLRFRISSLFEERHPRKLENYHDSGIFEKGVIIIANKHEVKKESKREKIVNDRLQ